MSERGKTRERISGNLGCDGEEYKEGKWWQTQPTAQAAQENHLTNEILIVYICVCVHRKMYERELNNVFILVYLPEFQGNCILCIGLAVFCFLDFYIEHMCKQKY